jgi:hypothetical protein
MDEKLLAELLRKNPRVDKELIERTQRVLRALLEAGVRPTALSSSPPAEPYAISRGIRSNWRPQVAK